MRVFLLCVRLCFFSVNLSDKLSLNVSEMTFCAEWDVKLSSGDVEFSTLLFRALFVSVFMLEFIVACSSLHNA